MLLDCLVSIIVITIVIIVIIVIIIIIIIIIFSLQLSGKKVNCSDYFMRVPTDSGMCCALNSAEALRFYIIVIVIIISIGIAFLTIAIIIIIPARTSEYEDLVISMQGQPPTKRVHSKVICDQDHILLYQSCT